jgi:hypothetical protein
MRRPAVSLFLLCATWITPAHSAPRPGQWTLSKSGGGITAYSRTSGNRIHEFKAIAIVDARMEVVAQIIRDVPGFPNWMAFCKKGEILKKFDENNMIVHIVMDFPVVNDRDLVVKTDTVYDLQKARCLVKLTQVKNTPFPVPPGVVRMPVFSGSYRFEFITREKTGVIFTYQANPGGIIPAFVTNIFSKQLLFDTVSNLKNTMVHIERYRNAAEKSRGREIMEGILGNRGKVRNVIRARMREHYRDYRSIDRLLRHDIVIDKFLTGEAGRLTEIVFFAQGSRSRITEAARGAIELILKTATRDGQADPAITGDPALINRLIDGPKPGEKCVYDAVIEKAWNSLKNEFKN